MATKRVEIEIKEEDLRFTKQQVKSACKCRDRQDLIEAIFDDNIEYTWKQVEEKIETFMKGKVN